MRLIEYGESSNANTAVLPNLLIAPKRCRPEAKTSSPSRTSRSDHRWSSSLGWGARYKRRDTLEWRCSFPAVSQQSVTCDIYRLGEIHLWLGVMLDLSNVVTQPIGTIVRRRSLFLCMHFTTKISSRNTVPQGCFFVRPRERARLREGKSPVPRFCMRCKLCAMGSTGTRTEF